jgi:hypothetical protein
MVPCRLNMERTSKTCVESVVKSYGKAGAIAKASLEHYVEDMLNDSLDHPEKAAISLGQHVGRIILSKLRAFRALWETVRMRRAAQISVRNDVQETKEVPQNYKSKRKV